MHSIPCFHVFLTTQYGGRLKPGIKRTAVLHCSADYIRLRHIFFSVDSSCFVSPHLHLEQVVLCVLTGENDINGWKLLCFGCTIVAGAWACWKDTRHTDIVLSFQSHLAPNNLHIPQLRKSTFKLAWNSFITILFLVAHQSQAHLSFRESVQ